jgi:glycosyltransferase involved in cell wall biosynthesis
VGRLKPYKNVDVIIKAFAQVYASYPKARLAIMGEGETWESLVTLIHELGLKKAVTMYGKVSDEQKSTILSKSWAMLQPSMVEGWGITVIEANASGTPVIASNVPGLKDSILHGKTGVLVPPGDVDQFARCLIDFILHERYRLYLSQHAYIWSQQFSWEKSAQIFMKVLILGTEESLYRKNVSTVLSAGEKAYER